MLSGSAQKNLPEDRATGKSRPDAILDAAEQVMAVAGYDGSTMREIAETAGVAQGLIHYHFSNKQTLYEELVARRSVPINQRRTDLLDQLFAAPEPPSLEAVVEALFRPTIETGLSLARDGSAFARIVVSVANSPAARDQHLAKKYYDPMAQKFIDALMRMESGLSKPDAVWAYMFAIGVGMTMMARTGRPARLSEGQCDDSDADVVLSRIIPFICGGIRALARSAP